MKKPAYKTLQNQLQKLRQLTGSNAKLAVKAGRVLAGKAGNIADIELKGDIFHVTGLANHEAERLDDALAWYLKALALRQQCGNKNGQAATLNNIGLVHSDKGLIKDSIPFYRDAIKIRLETGDLNGLAGTYNNIGLAYQKLANYQKAMEHYYKALKIWEGQANRPMAALAYRNMGVVHNEQGNKREALKLYIKSRKLYVGSGDKISLLQLNNSIGVALQEQRKYDEAMLYFKRNLKASQAMQYRTGVLTATNNIGALLKLMGRPGPALRMSHKCLQLAIAENDYSYQAMASQDMGEIYLLNKDYKRAGVYLQKALAMAQKTAAKDTEVKIYHALAHLYEATKQPVKALRFYKRYDRLKNSISNTRSATQISQLQTRYEVSKKEEQIEKARLVNEASKLKARQALAEIDNKAKQLEIEHLRNVDLKREKDRSEALLLNILPEEVALELKEKGTAEAKYFENVTVLFTDFQGFTRVAERLRPQQLVDELHVCFSAFDEIMEKYNVEKIKTVGDAYLAASGLPVASAGHAVDMVMAAIEIRDS